MAHVVSVRVSISYPYEYAVYGRNTLLLLARSVIAPQPAPRSGGTRPHTPAPSAFRLHILSSPLSSSYLTSPHPLAFSSPSLLGVRFRLRIPPSFRPKTCWISLLFLISLFRRSRLLLSCAHSISQRTVWHENEDDQITLSIQVSPTSIRPGTALLHSFPISLALPVCYPPYTDRFRAIGNNTHLLSTTLDLTGASSDPVITRVSSASRSPSPSERRRQQPASFNSYPTAAAGTRARIIHAKKKRKTLL